MTVNLQKIIKSDSVHTLTCTRSMRKWTDNGISTDMTPGINVWSASDDIRSWWDVLSGYMMTTPTLYRWTLLPRLLQLLSSSASWCCFWWIFSTIFTSLGFFLVMVRWLVFLWRQWSNRNTDKYFSLTLFWIFKIFIDLNLYFVILCSYFQSCKSHADSWWIKWLKLIALFYDNLWCSLQTFTVGWNSTLLTDHLLQAQSCNDWVQR